MEISRKSISRSSWIPIPAVFIGCVLLSIIFEFNHVQQSGILDLLLAVSEFMLIGAIIWLPSLIICLLIERYAVPEIISKRHLIGLLLGELFIPYSLSIISLQDRLSLKDAMGFFIILALAQAVRCFYLIRKKSS